MTFDKSKITDENVEDIMSTAGMAITYWAVEPTSEDFAAAPDGEYTIRDGEADDDEGVYHISPDQIREATVKIAEGGVVNDEITGYVRQAFDDWTAEDGIEGGVIDAWAADAIVQYACFGEVVYG